MFRIWLVIFAVALYAILLNVGLHAAPPPGSDPTSERAQWFRGLRTNDGKMSCCELSDCEVINDDHWRVTPSGDYEVFVGPSRESPDDERTWVKVPTETILNAKSNPTGGAVVCHVGTSLFCFIRAPDV